MRYLTVLLILFIIQGCGSKPQPILSASEQYKYAKGFYDNGKYYKAQIAFENLIYTYPGNTVIDTAQYYLGMSCYNQKEYGIAAGEFKKLISAYNQSDFTDDAQYRIAMCHYRMSPKYQLDQAETYLAVDEFRLLLSNYPTSSFRDSAIVKIKELEDKLSKKMFMAGRLYQKMGNYEPALTYFVFVRDNYPATDWAVQAFYYTGEVQARMGNNNEALTTFENFLLGFSNHKLASKAREQIEKITAKIGSDKS